MRGTDQQHKYSGLYNRSFYISDDYFRWQCCTCANASYSSVLFHLFWSLAISLCTFQWFTRSPILASRRRWPNWRSGSKDVTLDPKIPKAFLMWRVSVEGSDLRIGSNMWMCHFGEQTWLVQHRGAQRLDDIDLGRISNAKIKSAPETESHRTVKILWVLVDNPPFSGTDWHLLAACVNKLYWYNLMPIGLVDSCH